MPPTIRCVSIALVAALAACLPTERYEPPPPPGELTLVTSESSIWFIGIKNNAVAVPGAFVGLQGQLSIAKRRAVIDVPIGSLDTGLPERDTNIRTHFFNAARFPSARLTIEEVRGPIGLPPVGSSVDGEAVVTLEILNNRVDLTAAVRITREGPARIRVTSTRPLVLTVEELGLARQYAMLKAVCGHEALSGAVPVQVDLVFGARLGEREARAAGTR